MIFITVSVFECQNQLGKRAWQLFHSSLKYLVLGFPENDKDLVVLQ